MMEQIPGPDDEVKAPIGMEDHAAPRGSRFSRRSKVMMLAFAVLLTGAFCALLLRHTGGHQKLQGVFGSNSEYTFGIDISHYQGRIDWDDVSDSHHPIKFVIMRATMGDDGKDKQYKRNWKHAQQKGYVRGAYHYYRPHENSEEQFRNFAASVKLEPGDLPPVLDVEARSNLGDDNLREGVQNWLKLAEEAYGVKPILYTSRGFYHGILKGRIKGYHLWIASYTDKDKIHGVDWLFHQFTDKVRVKGIHHSVDGNDFKGSVDDLGKLCLVSVE